MKNLIVLISILSLTSVGFAQPKHQQPAPSELLSELNKSPAVVGAFNQAKKISGAVTCEKLQITRLSAGSFEAMGVCTNPGDVKESERIGINLDASGMFTVTGTLQEGFLMITKIEFQLAG